MSKSYCHRGGDEPLLGSTIPGHFAGVVERFPHREAIVSIPQNRRLSYRALADAIEELAKGLLALGFKKGNRIGIWSTNNVEWLLLQMATARIGAILVNINPAYGSYELAYALKHVEVEGLFTIPSFRDSNYVDMLREIIPELGISSDSMLGCREFPHLRHVILYEPSHPYDTKPPSGGFMTWTDVLDAGRKVLQHDLDTITGVLDMDDPINIQYTSGTTGYPKAVVLSHHNILNNAYFSSKTMQFTEQDRLCIPVPFYHCFGMVLANLLCLTVAACAVIPCEHFNASNVLQALERERCTAIHGVPTMFIAELEHAQFKTYDLSTLRTGIIAGAPCPPPLVRRIMTDMHCPEILIGYGETEASPLTHLTSRKDSMEHRTDTVGRNLPHQEVKIIDPRTGQTVPLGKIGEICFRGYHVMKGYYGDIEATREVVDNNGWLHSGDLGSMDVQGYVRITGRLKEMIIRGGENIYPREIEELLFAHPKVVEAAVFGIPDEFYGEEIVAWVQLYPGEHATVEEIQKFCKGRIAHFKIPKFIQFVERFPQTVTGKVQKFKMRDTTINQINQDNRTGLR